MVCLSILKLSIGRLSVLPGAISVFHVERMLAKYPFIFVFCFYGHSYHFYLVPFNISSIIVHNCTPKVLYTLTWSQGLHFISFFIRLQFLSRLIFLFLLFFRILGTWWYIYSFFISYAMPSLKSILVCHSRVIVLFIYLLILWPHYYISVLVVQLMSRWWRFSSCYISSFENIAMLQVSLGLIWIT